MLRSPENVSDESQASQLIANALRGANTKDVAPGVGVEPRESEPLGGRSISDPDIRPPIPRYHFYGLANTQSQSDGAIGAGSKPDAHSRKDNTSSSDVTTLPLPNQPLSRGTTEGEKERGTPAMLVIPDANQRQGKDVKLVSGSPVATAQLPGQRKLSGQKKPPSRNRRPLSRQKQRSLSPASDDSFAGPLPYPVQEMRYMEKSKNFQLPLSELGCTQESSIEGESSDHLPASSSPPTMYASLPHNRRAEPPSARPQPRGQILVAGTPSDPSQQSAGSGVSQPQSQNPSQIEHVSHSQGPDAFPDGQNQNADHRFEPFTQAPVERNMYASSDDEGLATQVSSPRYPSTEPSSSYARLLKGTDDVATQLATQVIEEATQVTNAAPTEYPTGRLVTYSVGSEIPQPADSSRQQPEGTAPRTLLSMVNPAKRWRFQGYQPAEPNALPAYPETQVVDESSLDAVTQLYAEAYARVARSRRGIDEDREGSILTRFRSPTPQGDSKDEPHVKNPDTSELDIVPDSEATGAALAGLSSPVPSPEIPLEPTTAIHAGDAQEEEEEEEEEDVPLLQQTTRTEGKKKVLSRKDSTRKMPPPPAVRQPPTTNAPPGRTRAVRQPGSAGKISRPGGSWETGVVPSSNPQQDHGKKGRSASKAKAKVSANAKSRLTTPAIASRSTSPYPTESLNSEFPPAREYDRDTEPADDHDMDLDELDDLPTTSRKRKRTTSSSLAKPVSRTATRATKSTTPAARPSKRVKSLSVLRSGAAAATRVFALWKQDGHFYPGIVYSLDESSPSQYKIHFDDGTEDVVEVSKMRACRLKRGDHVSLIEADERAHVVDDSQCAFDSAITVEVSRDSDRVLCDVVIQDVRVAARSITSQWKDRILRADDLVAVVKPKSLKNSPTPSKQSLASIGSARNTRRILSNTGLVVTLSPGNANWDKDKDRLVSSIKASGGSVIDDWGSIFKMDGTFSLGGKRWVAKANEVAFTGGELERVFLLSDDFNRKPKFLMALALGIPCLSINWLERTIEEQKETNWQRYLLPAGWCEQWTARVSQQVDLEWGNSPWHLKEIMDNQVPPKLFSGKNVLCYAPEFLPAAKSKRTNSGSGKTKEAQGMVPRIILCMGASRVEAVAKLEHASQPLAQFDYVVVKDANNMDDSHLEGANCVHFGWVKDWLIAGRMLPMSE